MTATGVTVSGSTVTVTAAGTYQFTGSLTNGRIAAAGEVMVVVNAGTTNRLTDAASRATADTSTAALYSEDNLTITGTGSLTVRGNAVDGIASGVPQVALDLRDAPMWTVKPPYPRAELCLTIAAQWCIGHEPARRVIHWSHADFPASESAPVSARAGHRTRGGVAAGAGGGRAGVRPTGAVIGVAGV